ncbi:uncharacterized protein LOC142324770 [Lycorma delicatula]|uniref:uncharacterized protein LOC142324770 n=1 Tax=Lycorma delicatula TaxID=130591 RepID=UPI003F512FC1
MENCSQESDLMPSGALEFIEEELQKYSIPQDFRLFEEPNYNGESNVCDSTQNCTVEYECNPNHYVESSLDATVSASDEVKACDLIHGPTSSLPSTEDYLGPFNFKIQLSPSSKKHTWAYSEILRKVFINVDKVLLLQFKVGGSNPVNYAGLRVRALLMFVAPDHMHIPVDTCTLHWSNLDSKNQAHTKEKLEICHCVEYGLVGHVITTDNKHARYEFDQHSKRHSVTVPLEPVQPGFDVTTVGYQFHCKTSCQSGMARRPVNLIFTLETESGEVIGRCSLLVKICSCPKRDKDREEGEHLKNGQKSVFSEPGHGKYKLVSSHAFSNSNLPSHQLPSLQPPANNDHIELPCKRIKIDPQFSFQENHFQQQLQLQQQQQQQRQLLQQSFDRRCSTCSESEISRDSVLTSIQLTLERLCTQTQEMNERVINELVGIKDRLSVIEARQKFS